MTAVYVFESVSGSDADIVVSFDAGPNYDVIAKFVDYDTGKMYQTNAQTFHLPAGNKYYLAGVAANQLVPHVPPPRITTKITQAGHALRPLFPQNLSNPCTIGKVFAVVGPVHKMSYPDIAIQVPAGGNNP
tara:strand:- start:1525 stop:1917 length:393 start_codon:yes stop_codon:yes gene_type:complete